jgi:glycosyltransferase involved in cell wall biosynthesis
VEQHVSNSNVLLILGRSLALLGGTTRDIYYEVAYLAKRGYHTWLMCPASSNDGMPAISKEENLHLVYISDKLYSFLPGPFYGLVSALHRSILIRRLDRAYRYRYIHAHDVFSALASILVGRRRKTILHLHSISSKDRFTMSRPFSSLSLGMKIVHSILYMMTCVVEVFVYNIAKVIVCVSEWEWNNAMKKRLFNKKHIIVLRNGIDIDMFRPKPEVRKKLRQQLNIDNKGCVCMFLGRMVPKNGPLLIAQAIPTVNRIAPNVSFVFVGIGGEKDRLLNYISQHNLQAVWCMEATPAEDILPLADIFVSHVSSLGDGHGQTILEAMASGIPTITGRDAITEKVFAEDEILLINKDDPKAIAEAIVTLVRDKDKRKLLSLNGMERVRKDLSVASQLERLESLAISIVN